MEYPIWFVPAIGGGLVIAAISILHVYLAHFAIGGGLFLVLTERKAYREGDPRVLAYLRQHTQFFLLATIVLGAVTGVGIWLSIGLVAPLTTSSLIAVFVWLWSMEYVPFFVEIVAILVYYYGWERLTPQMHQFVGWVYFVAAWLSLFFVNGILTFMLTPGRWLETRNFWDAFFNPTMLPSLLIRSSVTIALAGLFALVTTSRLQPEDFRNRMVRYSARWLLPAFVGIPLGGVWYFTQVPPLALHQLAGGAAAVQIFLALSALFSVIIFAFTYFGPYREPQRFSFAFAVMFMVMGLLVTGVSEWVRESIRKPYLIYQYIYANEIYPSDADRINAMGILNTAKWARVREIRPDSRLQAGAEVFRLECSACHAIEGYNGIKPLVARWPEEFIFDQLGHLDTLKGFMPPFLGTSDERSALATYLASLNSSSDHEAARPTRSTP